MKALVAVVFHLQKEIEPVAVVVQGDTAEGLARAVQNVLLELQGEYVDTKGGRDHHVWRIIASHSVTILPEVEAPKVEAASGVGGAAGMVRC